MSSTLRADASVRISGNVKKYDVGLQADILEDKQGTLTLDQVRSETFNSQWKKSRQKIINFAFSRSVFWIRITFESNMPRSKTFWLEGGGALQDYIDYYQIHDGNLVSEIHTGDRLPFDSRKVEYRNFLFPFKISPHETRQVYLRLSNHDGFHEPLPIILWDREQFTWESGIRNLGLGLYFGIMLAMGIYNFFIFLSVRDSAYAFYVTYIVGLVLWLATYFGLTFQYLWPGSPNWGNQMILYSSSFWSIFMILFIQSLLDTKNTVPWFDKLNRIALCALLFTIFTGFTGRYSLGIGLLVFIGFTMCLTAIAAGIICFRKGSKPARYFLLAWTTLLISIVVFVLKIAGILPAILVVEKSVQIGSAIEVILLSLSLADRINELKKEKLMAQAQALQAVESTLKLKSDFITAISHELRTPMNAIIGGLEVIKKHPHEHLKSPMNVIQEGSAEMMNLVNDILTHTEIQTGNLTIRSEHVDLPSCLEELHETYRHICNDRQLALHWYMDGNLPQWIRTDREKCCVIFSKLLDNAVKFTKKGGITVTIGCSRAAIKHQLTLTVSDTGIGIPKHRQDSIFESFTQSEGGFQRPYGGLGIGLAISKKLAEALGGEILFTSEEGNGSVFMVVLPIETVTEPPLETTPPRVSPEGPILIVEDNPVNQTVMKKLLEKIGYTTLTASHGQEAIEILNRTPVCLILMDLQMPVMDGFTCTEKIRTHESARIKTLPIIAVTANLMDADKKRCMECGMNAYLKKPVTLDDLQQSILRFIGG